VTFVLDLTAEFDRLRAELRDEILAELRADQQAETWPEWQSAGCVVARSVWPRSSPRPRPARRATRPRQWQWRPGLSR
jgi:hypothetical protein